MPRSAESGMSLATGSPRVNRNQPRLDHRQRKRVLGASKWDRSIECQPGVIAGCCAHPYRPAAYNTTTGAGFFYRLKGVINLGGTKKKLTGHSVQFNASLSGTCPEVCPISALKFLVLNGSHSRNLISSARCSSVNHRGENGPCFASDFFEYPAEKRTEIRLRQRKGRTEMAEFFVYTCEQCRSAYSGALDVVDCGEKQTEGAGICPTCLDQLFDFASEEEGMEHREASSDSAQNL